MPGAALADLVGDVRIPGDLSTLPLASLPFGPALPSPLVRYGLACLAAERAGDNLQSPYVDQVWRHLLGALKIAGPWEWNEPEFSRLRTGPTGARLAALLRRGQCQLPLARFIPIGTRGARLLDGSLIRKPDQLLRATADPIDRASLANETGVKDAELQAWGKLAELALVLEVAYGNLERIGANVADLVSLAVMASVTDVPTMAKVNPTVTGNRMRRANRANWVTTFDQFEAVVFRWREAAERWVADIGRPGESSMIRPTPKTPKQAGDAEPDKPDKKEKPEA